VEGRAQIGPPVGAVRPHADEPLSEHVVFRTADPELAIAHAGSMFAPHRLTLHDARPRLQARMNACRVGSVLLAYFDYGARLTLRARELENLTVLLLPLTGSIRVEQGGREVVATPATGGVLRPDLASKLVWSEDLTVLALAFDHLALRTHLGRLIGAEVGTALVFDPEVAPQRRASTWDGMTRLLIGLAAETGQGDPAPLVAAEAGRAAMSMLLISQPHSHRAAMSARSPAAAPRAVRTVADLIRSDPGADHRIPELAAAAGISPRSLQVGFRRLFGVSPSTFLREARLDRVHDTLAAADPTRHTVAEIATEGGFPHLGRFAGEYRKRFGQPPSATLRSGRNRS
jgi:AraC-like DNA-binding protein